MFDLKYFKMIKMIPKNDPQDMPVNMFIAYEDLVLNPYMTVEERHSEFLRRKVILERVMKSSGISEYPCSLRQHKTNLKLFDNFLKEMTTIHLFFQYGDRLVPRTFSKLEDKLAKKIMNEVKIVAKNYRY